MVDHVNTYDEFKKELLEVKNNVKFFLEDYWIGIIVSIGILVHYCDYTTFQNFKYVMFGCLFTCYFDEAIKALKNKKDKNKK